jgi:phosphoenolpyruvate carboxylase
MYLVFGVGTALKHFEETDEWQKSKIYMIILCFKTLLENSMMSMAKSFFRLLSHEKRS